MSKKREHKESIGIMSFINPINFKPMKKLITQLLVLTICLIIPITGLCQWQTRQIVEGKIKSGKYELRTVRNSYKTPDRFDPQKECWFSVSNCEIDLWDFRAFFDKNRQYKAEDVVMRTILKYGDEVSFIISFSFHNKPDLLSAFELCVRAESKDPNLKIPPITNLNESTLFYQKYVKKNSKLATEYKATFKAEFSKYLKENPEGMKTFCQGSPYTNNELVKELDVWQLLMDCNRKYDYVYYLTQSKSNGYYFDKQRKYAYQGDLKYGKPNGKGKTLGWEGTFKDGKKNGQFTWSYTNMKYDKSNLGIGGFSINNFNFKKTGKCVNDQWDGEVVYEISCPNRSTRKDVVKEYYSKGKCTKTKLVSKALSDDLREKDRLASERAKEQANERNRRYEQERRQYEQKVSSVNESNVMNEVESIKKFREDKFGITYTVTFDDRHNMYGYINYRKSDGKWGVEGGFFGGYIYPDPNSKAAAILELYNRLYPTY